MLHDISGMEMINKFASDFAIQTALSGRRLFLVAPFGPKPITLASWVAYRRLARSGADVEIANVSGFQYTSVYSIGKGHMFAFEMPSLSDMDAQAGKRA